jgi:hypothetical protein
VKNHSNSGARPAALVAEEIIARAQVLWQIVMQVLDGACVSDNLRAHRPAPHRRYDGNRTRARHCWPCPSLVILRVFHGREAR